MKKFSARYTPTLAIALMCCLFTGLALPAMAASDPFLEAGFIQARKQAPAMDFTLEDIEGRQVRLSDFRGKVILLFFWTTW